MIPILQASAGAEIFSRTDPVRDAQEEVRAILEQVKAKGDAALKEYTKAFDGADISSIELGQGPLTRGSARPTPCWWISSTGLRSASAPFTSTSCAAASRPATRPG